MDHYFGPTSQIDINVTHQVEPLEGQVFALNGECLLDNKVISIESKLEKQFLSDHYTRYNGQRLGEHCIPFYVHQTPPSSLEDKKTQLTQ